jgi:hypothetical protein
MPLDIWRVPHEPALYGTLRPHERVGVDVGFEVVPDLDPERPFHEIAFASAHELKGAGIVPANGQRISFRISYVCGRHGVRAVDIELEQNPSETKI